MILLSSVQVYLWLLEAFIGQILVLVEGVAPLFVIIIYKKKPTVPRGCCMWDFCLCIIPL